MGFSALAVVVGDDGNAGRAGLSLEGGKLVDAVFGSAPFAFKRREVLAENGGGGGEEIIKSEEPGGVFSAAHAAERPAGEEGNAMAAIVNGAFVAPERAGELLLFVFGAIVAGENEKGVFDEFFSGAAWVVGVGEVVAETFDEDIVFVNEIESHAVSGRAVFVAAGSDDLLVADFLIGRVRAVVNVGGEVEEEGFILRVC